MNPLNEAQRARVESSMDIARRAARNAARKQRRHDQQLLSAAQEGLMEAAESYDRLGVTMPWGDWASIHANRAITDYFNSKFGRRFRHEVTSSVSKDTEKHNCIIDPKGENGLQMVDVQDLLAKIPTFQHSLLARRVVLDRATKLDAGEDAGFLHRHGLRAWDKVARNLIVWGDIDK